MNSKLFEILSEEDKKQVGKQIVLRVGEYLKPFGYTVIEVEELEKLRAIAPPLKKTKTGKSNNGYMIHGRYFKSLVQAARAYGKNDSYFYNLKASGKDFEQHVDPLPEPEKKNPLSEYAVDQNGLVTKLKRSQE